MKYNFISKFQNSNLGRSTQYFLSLVTIPFLAACTVDSTTLSDSDILANFFVQNDNGDASVLVTLSTENLSGSNDVTLTRREALFFEQDGQIVELSEEDDGEYAASLPANSSGLFTFIIERLSQEDIDNNRAYLPDTFQELVAEPAQIGPVIELSWRTDDTQQVINGFTVPAAVESFNAVASCQSPGTESDNTPFALALSEGQIAQEGGRQVLEIAATEQLTQLLNLSAEAAASTSCEFDVQLVRDITGTADNALDNRSTAGGQTLLNVPVQWSAQ